MPFASEYGLDATPFRHRAHRVLCCRGRAGISLIPDLTYIPGVPGATGGQTAVLMLMHAVAVGVIVGLLTGLVGTRSR